MYGHAEYVQALELEVTNLNIIEAEIVQHMCTAVWLRMLADTKVNGHRLDAFDQWCLRRLLGIKWYQFVSNAKCGEQVVNLSSLSSPK